MSATIAVVLAAYVVLVLVVGALASRASGRSPEEYFLAGRRMGSFVLFMALFGTNTTAFVLVGVPALAYHQGVGVFGYNATVVALGIPLTFWCIGSPARRMAQRLGALTPAELYTRRFGSRPLGWLLCAVFAVYTIPYMVIAADGAGVTLQAVSKGAIPTWVGVVGVLAVSLGYTTMGGMRATAWTNVLQGGIFLGFCVAAFFLVPNSLGGFERATEAARAVDPELLVRRDSPMFAPRAWASWGLAISLSVIAFPHMLVRLIAARSESSLKRVTLLYPPALALLWLPAVMIGVWGAGAHPGLVGKESDRIFGMMVTDTLGPVVGAFGFLAVLAAVMSTLDAQILTLGSMLTRDVLGTLKRAGGSSGKRDVRAGRWFGVAVAVLVVALWQVAGQSIFSLASVAFSGYVTLVPALFLGVRWRRFTATGAIASIVAGNAVYALCLLEIGELSATKASWLGFLPVVWGLSAAVAGALVGTALSSPPDAEETARAFGGSSARG